MSSQGHRQQCPWFQSLLQERWEKCTLESLQQSFTPSFYLTALLQLISSWEHPRALLKGVSDTFYPERKEVWEMQMRADTPCVTSSLAIPGSLPPQLQDGNCQYPSDFRQPEVILLHTEMTTSAFSLLEARPVMVAWWQSGSWDQPRCCGLLLLLLRRKRGDYLVVGRHTTTLSPRTAGNMTVCEGLRKILALKSHQHQSVVPGSVGQESSTGPLWCEWENLSTS